MYHQGLDVVFRVYFDGIISIVSMSYAQQETAPLPVNGVLMLKNIFNVGIGLRWECIQITKSSMII